MHEKSAQSHRKPLELSREEIFGTDMSILTFVFFQLIPLINLSKRGRAMAIPKQCLLMAHLLQFYFGVV